MYRVTSSEHVRISLDGNTKALEVTSMGFVRLHTTYAWARFLRRGLILCTRCLSGARDVGQLCSNVHVIARKDSPYSFFAEVWGHMEERSRSCTNFASSLSSRCSCFPVIEQQLPVEFAAEALSVATLSVRGFRRGTRRANTRRACAVPPVCPHQADEFDLRGRGGCGLACRQIS